MAYWQKICGTITVLSGVLYIKMVGISCTVLSSIYLEALLFHTPTPPWTIFINLKNTGSVAPHRMGVFVTNIWICQFTPNYSVVTSIMSGSFTQLFFQAAVGLDPAHPVGNSENYDWSSVSDSDFFIVFY